MAKAKKAATASLSMADRDGWIWYDGKMVPWRDATTHVLTHTLHYGMGVFEGVRAYKTVSGTQIFRLREHMQRLLNSAKVYRMNHTRQLDELCGAATELVGRSGLQQCYLRPIMFRSLDEAHPAFGVNPFPNPMTCYIGAWDWGKYLGDAAIDYPRLSRQPPQHLSGLRPADA